MNEVTIYLVNGKVIKIKMSDATYNVFASGFLNNGKTAHKTAQANAFGANHEQVAFFTVKPLDEEVS